MATDAGTCPNDADLEAFARHRSDSLVVEHVASCESCQQRLDALHDDNDFLDELAATLKKTPTDRGLPQIPGYRIIEEIHRGGQGVVYKALQESTRRWVAVKTLLRGDFASPRELRRFEREIELIAVLEHANIVTVYESGTADGQPYYAMEYVRGSRLQMPKKPPTRAQLPQELERIRQICAAAAYAHQRGIIHRDLKPGNILVDSEGRPRIVDFGLARVLAEPIAAAGTQATRTGEFVGTFAFSAPEQLSGTPERIDTRTDVYALGLIMYQALTGESAYDTSLAVDQLLVSIRNDAPRRPSLHNPAINDELETIILTCLAKDPDRRYRSAGELLADLESYTAGRPILAKRDSAWYLLRKTAHRHRGPVFGALLASIFLVVFSVTMSVLYRRAQQAEEQALANAAELRAALRHSTIQQARLRNVTGNATLAEELLWSERLREPAPAENARSENSATYWGLWDLYRRHPCVATLKVANQPIVAVALTEQPDPWLHAVARDGLLRSWPLRDPGALRTWEMDGLITGAVHVDGMMVVTTDQPAIEVWDLARRTRLAEHRLSFQPEQDPAVSACGERVALYTPEGGLWTWYPFTGQIEQHALAYPVDSVVIGALPHETYTVSRGGMLCRWDGEQLIDSRRTRYGGELAMSPQGGFVGLVFRTLSVFQTSNLLQQFAAGNPAEAHALTFSPDESVVFVGTRDAAIRAWRMTSSKLWREYRGHTEPITALTSVGSHFVSGDRSGVVKLWETERRTDVMRIKTDDFSNHALALSADGTFLATGGAVPEGLAAIPSPIRLWDLRSNELDRELTGHTGIVSAVAFSPDGEMLASCDYDGTIRLWDAHTGEPRAQRTLLSARRNQISALTFDPKGETLIAAIDTGQLAVWNPRTDVLDIHDAHDDRMPAITCRADGRYLVTASKDHRAIVWDTSDWQPAHVLMHSAPLRAARFSADGKLLATAGDDCEVTIWDGETFDQLRKLTGHRQHIFAVDFSPDGRLLVSGAREGGLLMWDVATGENLTTMLGERRGEHVMSTVFGPNGSTLITAHTQEGIGVWDLRHFDRHMAGNTRHQLDQLVGGHDLPDAAAWQSWADEILTGSNTWLEPARTIDFP